MSYNNNDSTVFRRLPAESLRKLSQTVPARAAINRITNDVLAMPWVVLPPEEDLKRESAWQEARRIKQAILHPHRDPANSYAHFVRAVIADILTLGYAAVERQVGDSQSQPFWLWPLDAALVSLNDAWSYRSRGICPRYYFGDASDLDSLTPLNDDEAFLIIQESTTYAAVCPGAVEVAALHIVAWLHLKADQRALTDKSSVRDILQVVDASDEEFLALLKDWSPLGEGAGKTSVVSKEVRLTSLSAKTDKELYPGYESQQLRNIAMAFDLSVQDLGLPGYGPTDQSGFGGNASYPSASHQMALLLHENLYQEVTEFYRPGFRHELLKAPKTEDEARRTAMLLYDAGLITQNEARLHMGQESIGPAGDRFSDGTVASSYGKWFGV